MQNRVLLLAWRDLFVIALAAGLFPSVQKAEPPQTTRTKVVLLGTGTPAPDPERSGPATAVVVDDVAYTVDLGPGVVRRARAAATAHGLKALEPTNLRIAFLTHLHSDHTIGFPDLIFTPWTMGRRVPLEVYGPKGLKEMADHLLAAYRIDIDTRTNPDGNQRTFPGGSKVNAHEIASGLVYKDGKVTVTAFPTKHAMESYGYRFDTPDRVVVISGDTNPTQAKLDVGRLQVAVDDAPLMRRFQRFGDLPRDGQRFGQCDGTGQRRALDVLHHQIVGADVVQRADVGMIQCGHRAGFPLEALVELLGAKLHCDNAIEPGVAGFVHFPHSSRSDR